MSYCIPKTLAGKFIDYLKKGKITPDKLIEMSSEERRALFSEIVGEAEAKEMNSALEAKLILKDQKRGLVTWLKQTSGLSTKAKTDIASKIDKLETVLTPTTERAFLEDLASKRLGADVTVEEAGKLVELTKKVRETETAKNAGGNRLDWGRAKVALRNYISDLKNANAPTLFQRLKTPLKSATDIAAGAKGLKASLDNSAIFRQGWKTLFTNPVIWQRNALKSFSDLVGQFGGKQVMDEVQAEIQSRPTIDLMEKAKLDIGTSEEQFPAHWPEKIPILGRAYKASEAAFTGFVYRTRADVFDKMLKIAKASGQDVTDTENLQSIGKLVNSLTGRGNLGRAEPAARVLNSFFFSPRFLKSNIDFLTAHQFQKDVSPFVRKQAAANLIKVVAGTASILAIANAIRPGSVDTDPRSPNFGKIKVNNTTFDFSGGMGSVLTLAARLLTMSTKSGTTGKITKLNSGKFGQPTATDVLVNFAEGKLSPAAGIVKDILEGKDYNGNKPTILNELNNLFTPLPILNAIELEKSENAPVLAGILADALGISVNTRTPKKTANPFR